MNVPSKQSCTGAICLQTLQKENASLREEVENMSLWLAGVISIWYHDVCYKAATEASVCHYKGWIMNAITGAILVRDSNMQTLWLSNSLNLHNLQCCNT